MLLFLVVGSRFSLPSYTRVPSGTLWFLLGFIPGSVSGMETVFGCVCRELDLMILPAF